MILLPIELLQKQLDELVLARSKALISLNKNQINAITYEKYIDNLTPKIETYKFAITILNQYT